MTALVLGNAEYPAQALKNTTNDSADIAEKLTEFGFTVIHLANSTKREIDDAVKSFRDNLNSNEIGLFYFAGHGMQIDGENYLTAIDTDFDSEMDAKYSSYPLNKVIDIMERSKNKTNIIILDACRNNPFERSWHRSATKKGLAPVFAPKGTIVAFATSPGEIAGDGNGRNGCYTEALLRHMSTPDIPIEEMFKRVRNSLAINTKNKQTSWEHTSLSGDFFFNIGLTNSIEPYSADAIADDLFKLDESIVVHDVIADLRTRNWYKQNPAARNITSEDINHSDVDSAFVFGRNMYQASCGSAHGASEYIADFRERTQNTRPELRKAILDGMLFEIFFNSAGEIREIFKVSKFNSVFDFQRDSEFDESFKFISDILATYSNRFHMIPGKERNVSVEVITTENENGEHRITGVYLRGVNILREDEDNGFNEQDGNASYEGMRKSDFEKRLSEEMLVPTSKLTVNYTFVADAKSKLLFPYSYTVAK